MTDSYFSAPKVGQDLSRWVLAHKPLVLNGNVYVIDAGLGVTRQFIEAGFTYDQA